MRLEELLEIAESGHLSVDLAGDEPSIGIDVLLQKTLEAMREVREAHGMAPAAQHIRWRPLAAVLATWQYLVTAALATWRRPVTASLATW